MACGKNLMMIKNMASHVAFKRKLPRANQISFRGNSFLLDFIAWIPKGILSRIPQICCRFLWRGNKEGNTFAWVKLEHIALPKKWGIWDMKNLVSFSKALVAKMG